MNNDRFKQLWADGVPTADICAEMGVLPRTVAQRARRLGLRSRLQSYVVSDPVVQARTDLAEMMANGCPSISEAARQLRITQSRADQHWQAIRRDLGEQAV